MRKIIQIAFQERFNGQRYEYKLYDDGSVYFRMLGELDWDIDHSYEALCEDPETDPEPPKEEPKHEPRSVWLTDCCAGLLSHIVMHKQSEETIRFWCSRCQAYCNSRRYVATEENRTSITTLIDENIVESDS